MTSAPGWLSRRPGRSPTRSARRCVATEWATEACQDERRWVRSAGSKSGLTVKVTGFSPMAGFAVTVIVNHGSPAENPVVGCHGLGRQPSEIKQYEEGQ